MTEKKNSNAHRKNKYAFHAYLKPEDEEKLILVKELRGIKTNPNLLTTLVNEEYERVMKSKRSKDKQK